MFLLERIVCPMKKEILEKNRLTKRSSKTGRTAFYFIFALITVKMSRVEKKNAKIYYVIV